MSFAQARRVASLSWPLYVTAAGALIVATAVSLLTTSQAIRWSCALVALGTVWLAGASFWAFHVMFDKSGLLSGAWLRNVAAAPARWVQITTGLEQTSVPLESLFPAAEGQVIDVYDPSMTTEPALTRARRGRGAIGRSEQLAAVTSDWADLVVIMLAAHEIRDPQGREQLFKEAARVVSANGRVVVVEHIRDLINTIVFGPGVFHFFPRSTWLQLAHSAGFDVEREFPITPFVRVFCLHRSRTSTNAARSDVATTLPRSENPSAS